MLPTSSRLPLLLVRRALYTRCCSSGKLIAHKSIAARQQAFVPPKLVRSPLTHCVSIRFRHTTAATPPQHVYRTLAFYKFHPLDQNELPGFRQQLLEDLAKWEIVGRIYISTEGINAQLSCPEQYLQNLQRYCEENIKPKVGNELMDFNPSTDDSGERAFRRLHVRIRKQLVADGLDPASYDLSNTPSHLSPAEWHEKLSTYKKKHGRDPILIDMRNHYESEIGYFEGAIRPDVETFRGSIKSMNEIVKDVPREQEVFMYCTGGIRCSKAGAILQSASGFKTVHLIEGGITAYGRWIREQNMQKESLFRGKNFTFDKRMGEPITDDVFGKCHICGEPSNRYQNCAHSSCNCLMICCSRCAARFLNTCGRLQCYDTVYEFKSKAPAEYYDKAGPIVINGIRAYVKEGDSGKRVVIGRSGAECEHQYLTRTRATDILGQPGDVLKEWAKAGRQLPPEQ